MFLGSKFMETCTRKKDLKKEMVSASANRFFFSEMKLEMADVLLLRLLEGIML